MDDENLNVEVLPDDYPQYDLSFKIIIIGDSGRYNINISKFINILGVGKSCLAIKATKNVFENNYLATVGFEFFTFNVRMNEKVIKLQIWDTCGQEIYRSLITNFYRNSSMAIIVYAIDE
jgi:Ras-related protein Rab-1A